MKTSDAFNLPNFIIPFKNPDKEFQEEPTSDLFMLSHSSRVWFYSTPSGGKTTAILNCLLHQKFDRMIVVHNDCNTKEHKNIDVEYFDETPDPNDEEHNLDPTIKV